MAQILPIASHLEVESILHPLSLGLGMWLGLASIPSVDNMQTFEKCSCTENAASVGSQEPVRQAHHCSCSKRAHLHLTLTTVTRRAENFKTIKLWGRLLQRAKMNSYSSDAYFIQFSSVAQPCPTFCDPMCRSTPGFRSSLKLMCIKSVMPSSHLILCRPLLLLPPIPPSIRVFSNESTLRIRWPKY